MEILNRIKAAKLPEVEAVKPIQGNIILHTGLPKLLGSDVDNYDTLYNRKARSADLMAFTNVIWCSLSDHENFVDNFTLRTLEHIMNISAFFWNNFEEGKFAKCAPSSFKGSDKAKWPNPEYRAFMYFRDVGTVCHPLISYEGKGTWNILRIEDVLEEVSFVKTKWALGSINKDNWLD